MIANSSKPEGIILGKTDHHIKFSVNDSMELFGVTIDRDLTFKQHVQKINNQFRLLWKGLAN